MPPPCSASVWPRTSRTRRPRGCCPLLFVPAAASEELEAPAAAAVCLLEVDEAAVGVRRVDEPSPPWTRRGGRQAPVGAREAPARVRPGAASTPSRWRSACSWPWRGYWGSARGSSSTESARRAARRHLRTVHLVAAGSARAQLRVSLRAKDSLFRSAKRSRVDFRNCWTPVFLNFAKNSRLGECFRNSWRCSYIDTLLSSSGCYRLLPDKAYLLY